MRPTRLLSMRFISTFLFPLLLKNNDLIVLRNLAISFPSAFFQARHALIPQIVKMNRTEHQTYSPFT